jgi:hypothetical protein
MWSLSDQIHTRQKNETERAAWKPKDHCHVYWREPSNETPALPIATFDANWRLTQLLPRRYGWGGPPPTPVPYYTARPSQRRQLQHRTISDLALRASQPSALRSSLLFSRSSLSLQPWRSASEGGCWLPSWSSTSSSTSSLRLSQGRCWTRDWITDFPSVCLAAWCHDV